MTNMHPHADQLANAGDVVKSISDSLETLEQRMHHVAENLHAPHNEEFETQHFDTGSFIADLRELSRVFAKHGADLSKVADAIPEM